MCIALDLEALLNIYLITRIDKFTFNNVLVNNPPLVFFFLILLVHSHVNILRDHTTIIRDHITLLPDYTIILQDHITILHHFKTHRCFTIYHHIFLFIVVSHSRDTDHGVGSNSTATAKHSTFKLSRVFGPKNDESYYQSSYQCWIQIPSESTRWARLVSESQDQVPS